GMNVINHSPQRFHARNVAIVAASIPDGKRRFVLAGPVRISRLNTNRKEEHATRTCVPNQGCPLAAVPLAAVPTGQRWNRGRLLSPFDDPGPGTFGIAFTLAGDTQADRVAPAYFGACGWGR